MPRPKPLEPKARIHLVIPNLLYARLRLMFHSDANANGLMKGAMSEFITAAIREKLDRSQRDLPGMPIHPPLTDDQSGAFPPVR